MDSSYRKELIKDSAISERSVVLGVSGGLRPDAVFGVLGVCGS